MVVVFGASDENILLATRMYKQRFPDCRQPTKNSFEKIIERFKRTGNVAYEKTEREKSALNQTNEGNVLLKVAEDPHISVRQMAMEFDISKSSVHRILKRHNMHPYHIQLHQELRDEDYQRRINFCEWAQDKIHRQIDFFDFVLFGDEATFHRNGCVNRHNFHYYSTTNPYHIVTHSQTRWSINVWGGIIGDYVVGPHFFDGRVNGGVYLDFLQNHLPQLLQHVPHTIRNRMWFLHDGAPVHHTAPIHNYLNNMFPNRWIGRGGPFSWPPRSPGLSKIDFFMWGYIKNEVYKIPPTTQQDMKQRIRDVFQTINVLMLQNVQRSFEERLQHCIDVNGGHFEHLC